MLDEDQQKIVNLKNGNYAVMAGAGSGKSTVLLHRCGSLNNEGEKDIICVTFTSEAAKNLRTRSSKLFPTLDSNIFCTLHSLALRFAYDHSDAFPFKLADNILAEDGVAANMIFRIIGDKINFKAFTTWVSLQKRNRVSYTDAIIKGDKPDFAAAYKAYEAAKRKVGILDFDDLIYYMVELLETRPDIRSKWQYKWVMMDEAQDACELDWRMLQLLTEKHQNLMCVGDAGQALFGFRGGIAGHFLNMDELFPTTSKLYLGNNYRSTQSIVDFGKQAYPYPEISTKFRSMSSEIGVEPVVTMYSTDYREAQEVVGSITQYNPDSCAILARTNLALRPFEEALLDAGLEYYVLGDSGFWESPEVKNVLYWIRCCAMLTDNSVIGAIRTPFWPTKYLKKRIIVEKITARTDAGETAWEACKNIYELSTFRNFLGGLFKYQYLPADEAVKGIITELKAVEFYKEEDNISPDRDPVANLRELSHAARRFGNLADFIDFIRRLQYIRKNRKGVCLSTIHASKGKEWPHVFVVSVNEGILPHSKSENIEEEKACFFVGVSRAEETLNVSYYGARSRFLTPWMNREDGVLIQEPERV